MNNDMRINIPNSFQKLESLPTDPDNSISYGKQTQFSNCFVIVHPITNEEAMPFDDATAVINGIHEAVSETQGLIEVKTGVTKNQKKYIYSIVKSMMEPSGMEYILTMHIAMENGCMNIQSVFDEIGITGMRDTAIMNKMISEGKVDPSNVDSWFKDPYDENFKKGIAMNLSESDEYDANFPQHPLSETRSLVKYIIENN